MSAIRFVFAVLFFVVALLVLIPAPTIFIWQWKLGALEYGQWMILGPIAVLVAGRRRSTLDSASVGLAVGAAVLFLSSGIRAAWYAGAAQRQMDAVFPAKGPAERTRPFSFLRMWSTGQPGGVDVQTIEFAQHNGVSLQLDFYPAQGRGAAPCVVVVHTGGWDSGRRDEFLAMNRFMARRGYAVAAIDYRLAPQWTWPAQREDALAAISYLQAHASELGIDPGKFVMFGRSAGGQIAEAVAATGEHPEIVGCIAFYAPADMQFAYQYAKPSDILSSDKLLRQYLGGDPSSAAQNYQTASPYLFANRKTPPTLLVHGAHDELVWVLQSQRYDEKLRAQNVPVVFLRLPWATHAFDYNFNGPGGQYAAWAIERFLRSVTAAKPQ